MGKTLEYLKYLIIKTMDNSKANEPMVKKSLMNALNNLERKASALVDLANFSDEVVEKLNNPRPHPEPVDDCGKEKTCDDAKQHDLIDLFNLVADRIDNATHRVGSNIEQIKSIIE